MELIHNRKQDTKGKSCPNCGRDLHPSYPNELCPMCMEMELFSKVKEYIRENNDVHEQDVADEFNIPVRKVKEWIREGRIQYKGEPAKQISSIACRRCGKPISFGSLCSTCHSLEQLQVISQFKRPSDANGEMHFIGKEKN